MDMQKITELLLSDATKYSYFWPQCAILETVPPKHLGLDTELRCKSEVSVWASAEGLSYSFVCGLSVMADYKALILPPQSMMYDLKPEVYTTDAIISRHSGYIIEGRDFDTGEYEELRNSDEEKALRYAMTNKINQMLQASIKIGEVNEFTEALLEVICRACSVATLTMQQELEALNAKLAEQTEAA